MPLTFQATFIIDDAKNVSAQFSGLFFFPSEHFQTQSHQF